MSKRSDEAVRLFKEGYNCSQSVVGAYADLFNIDKKFAMQMVSGFGAGMGRMREVCGAMSAIVFIASLKNGNYAPKDIEAKTKNYEIVRNLAKEFKEANGGSIICKELLGIDEMEESARPEDRTKEYYKKRPCIEIVREAALIIEKNLMFLCM